MSVSSIHRNPCGSAHLRPSGTAVGTTHAPAVVMHHYTRANACMRSHRARPHCDDHPTRLMTGNDRRNFSRRIDDTSAGRFRTSPKP